MTGADVNRTADTLEIQQLIIEWGYDLDIYGGMGVAKLCTADCDYRVAGIAHPGHEKITAFYTARNERVRTQQKDGVRTQRHTITNPRVSFQGAREATIEFLLVNYSAEGKAPALNLVGPTIIADCQMRCRLEGEDWKIASFDSQPIFIGDDPFLNASVVKK